MSETSLEQRKHWYRYFPASSLEFLVATRVLSIIFLLSLLVMHDVQRPILLAALVAVLWCDYVLILWWAIQVSLDLDMLAGRTQQVKKRWLLGLKAFLPSMVVACAIAPWPSAYGLVVRVVPSLARQGGIHSPAYHRLSLLGFVLAGILFLILAALAFRSLRRIELGISLWTALLFVPGVHWFAMHRVAAGLGRRIEQQRTRQAGHETSVSSSGSMAAADVTWALCMIPWLVVFAFAIFRGWPAAPLPFCGMLLAAIFAITDLAAIERIQRQFLQLFREP